MRVLIADDDRAIGLALQMALEDLGHECLVAEDGLAALELFERHGADAIISDWRMPGLEGPSLCRRVREQAPGHAGSRPYVYFILLTVLSEPRHVLAGMQAGADDFLTKPFTVDTLHARLIAAERVTLLHQTLAKQQVEQIRLAAERQQLIEQLRREHHQLEGVLQQLPAGVVIATAPTGEVVMVNEQVLRLWRRDDRVPPSTTEQQWRGFHPDGREYLPDEWPLMRSMQTGEVVTGELAPELLGAESFDILLTDVGLGDGMNGWQLATEARTHWPEMHVILGTGWAAGIDPEAARALGIAEVIAKPYRSADLARAISALE